MRISIKLSALCAVFVLASLGGVAAAHAESVRDSTKVNVSGQAQTQTTQQEQTQSAETEHVSAADKTTAREMEASRADGRKAEVVAKLDAKKLKSCQKKEQNVVNIMARIADRGQKQVDLFSAVATKTQDFYVAKGNTLSNYDALVADVAAKKAEAQAAVDAVKSASVTFKCDGSDPKGVAQSFKDHLKSGIEVLGAYRTSVKNLIVGVKSVQATEPATSEGGQ